MKIIFENQKVSWGKFPTTVFAKVSEIPICSKCNNAINDEEWAYFCLNKKFYHEVCFNTDSFSIEHYKRFIEFAGLQTHSDRFVYIKLLPELIESGQKNNSAIASVE